MPINALRKRVGALLTLAVLATLGAVAHGDDAKQSPPVADGSSALAERFSSEAIQMLRGASISAGSWQQSTALLEAATRLSPQEPRYARRLVEYRLQLHDTDGAIDAIKAYLELSPGDAVEQANQIDLYLSRMQTAGAKLKYTHAIMLKTALSAEVRSFAAFRYAQLLLAQTQNDEALHALDTSLKLNPLNAQSLRLKLTMSQATQTPFERVGLYLALIKANPTDPTVSTLLAQQLADVGMVPESINWFTLANGIYARTRTQKGMAFVRGLSSELVVGDRSDDAARLLDQYLAAVPEDADSWFVRMAIAKFNAEQNKDDQPTVALANKIINAGGVALTNNLAIVRKAIGVSGATTQPMNAPSIAAVGDLSGDAALLKKNPSAETLSTYISAVVELAWYELYFRHDASHTDQYLKQLIPLLTENDIRVIRLQGWAELVQGHPDAADIKFAAAASKDPYSALGRILSHPPMPGASSRPSFDLLAKYPSRPVGAVLYEALRGYGAKVSSASSADAIESVLNAFPRDLLMIIDQPNNFYAVRLEPVKSSFVFGEPVLVRVTLQNLYGSDLSVGQDAIIRPRLWFDAQMRGTDDKQFFGAAIGSLDRHFVLPANGSLSTIVRVDDTEMYSYFAGSPDQSITMNMTVCTNPMIAARKKGEQPRAEPGPAGYRVPMNQLLERTNVSIATAPQQEALFNMAAHGDGDQKIRTLDALTVYSMRIAGDPKSDKNAMAWAQAFTTAVRKAQSDPQPNVKAWAQFESARLAPAADRDAVINAMAASPDWQGRMLAVGLAEGMTDHGAALFSKLSKDTDKTVQGFAQGSAAALAAANAAATTQPAAR